MKKVTRKLRVKNNRHTDALMLKRLMDQRALYYKLLLQAEKKAV